MFGGLWGDGNHSFRCSTCSLNYPNAGLCKVCGSNTHLKAGTPPDEDLEEKVKLLTAETPVRLDEEHKITTWRAQQLVLAGCPATYALAFAKDREIDLHKAVKIFQGTSVELALEILL